MLCFAEKDFRQRVLCGAGSANIRGEQVHMFKKKAQIQKALYDKENQIPVMKCSISNGERVVGFKDIHTGKFEEVLFVRNDRDLEEFKAKYGVETIGKEY